MTRNIAAVDLGAESGRVILCRWDGNEGIIEEAHLYIFDQGYMDFPASTCSLKVRRSLSHAPNRIRSFRGDTPIRSTSPRECDRSHLREHQLS
jgi:hypothetical protein